MAVTMTSRERVLAALAHKEPDRVPVDVGGTMASGINDRAYAGLLEALGIAEPLIWDLERGHTAQVSEPVRRRLNLDVVNVRPPAPANSRTWMEGDLKCYEDCWGVRWACPPGGHYYVTHAPFAGEPSLDALERYPWPDPTDPAWVEGVEERVAAARRLGDYALCLSLPVGFIHQTQFLRGYEDWLVDLAANRPFIERMMDRVKEIQLEIFRRVLDRVGGQIDLMAYGDDIGFQTGPMVSPRMYAQIIGPRQRHVFGALHAHSPAYVYYHTCGSVKALIPALIDMGVDILNPIQVSATGMDTAELKRQFGRQLSFWGAIDSHYALPYGTPDDVRAEVRRRIDDLAGGGGYVLASVHNIQYGVSATNILAMIEEAQVYGRRG